MIDSTEGLRELAEAAAATGSVALDTEFVWTRTFWPRLGLVQAAWGEGESVLIDAPALDDWSPLRDLMENPDVRLILHDAPQDLTILRRACGGLPVNVFDTRQAAGFCGLGGTLSLNALLGELLDIELPKTETRTNWLKRPLTDRQIEYALDDVRHLHHLTAILEERVDRSGNAPAFEQERRLIEEPSQTADREPEDMWLRIKSASRLRGDSRTCLRELAAWRELEARRRDHPRNMVAPEKLIVDLARKMPTETADLGPWRKEYKQEIGRYGPELVEAVRRGLESGEVPELPLVKRTSALDRKVADWMALRDSCAEDAGIEPSFITTKAELSALAALDALPEEGGHRLFNGWRQTVFGRQLREASVEK